MYRELCHFHGDESIAGVPTSAGDGSMSFTCDRTRGHLHPGPYTWLHVPVAPETEESGGGVAAQFNLAIELTRALADFRGRWVEAGVLEWAYAKRCPENFAILVGMYGHTAIEAKTYTVTSFMGRLLGDMSRLGQVTWHQGPATGRWSYNSEISYWALPPAPAWEDRLTWTEFGAAMDYVPGSVER